MSLPNADIIRLLLIELGAGSDGGDAWPVFTGFLPDDNDNAIAVYDTSGKLDGRVMRTGEQITHPGVQVRVRGPVYPETLQKAQDIAMDLDGSFGITVEIGVDQYYIENISRTGDVLPMGVEQEGDRRRFNFTVNAVLTVRKK